MMKFLLLDLDDTILDFQKAEAIAISKTIRSFGVEPTQEILSRYHIINKQHWEAMERGELTRPQVLQGRFCVLFAELGREVDPAACAKIYENHLSQGHYFLPGAMETIEKLHGSYKLYLASNGTAVVQHSRLTSAGLYPWFEEIFISQELGHNKPSREFFEIAFSKIQGFDPAQTIMVGDSLTSDMLGGLNAGITTCWVNPEGKDCGEIRPHYQIESLAQLPALLERL